MQSAGQIADLGGGALMAAFGVMAALHERAALRRGPDGRRLDGRRRPLLAGDGRRPLLLRRRGAAARRAAARRRPHLLPALRGRRRLGHLRRPGAEVLGRPLQRRRPSRPDREAVRGAGLGGLGRGRRGLPLPHPRRVARLQRRARLLHRAGPRPRRGARLGAGPGARDGGRARAARARHGPPARRPGEDEPHPRRPDPPGARLRRAHRRGPGRGRLLGRGDRGDEGVGRRRRPRRRRRRESSAHERQRTSANGERPAADARAGRGLRRAGADDQALPARGPAAGAGQDQPQHGLLPARVRRPDQADQAPAGGALHAAEGDQDRCSTRTPTGPGAARARRPDPRPRARRRALPHQRRRGPQALRRPQGGASTASPSSRS